MPRDQEASLRPDRPASDDPLFREPADENRDATTVGASPIGDALSTGRHATAGDDTVPSDAPGEWVAGNKGPDYTPGDDTGTRPVADPADATTVDATTVDDPAGDDPDTLGTTDAVGAPDTTDTRNPTGSLDPFSTSGTTDGTGTGTTNGTDTDLRTTRDPEVAPDSALGAEPATAADPATTRADTTGADTTDPAATTPADPADTVTSPDAATATTPPTGTPVPGAPGTAESTRVGDATAPFVTNGDELHADWARIQSSFVDDPRGSVSQAADLVQQVSQSLVTAVQQREQTLRGAWDSQDGADTEHLRTALRDYRAFFELLVKL